MDTVSFIMIQLKENLAMYIILLPVPLDYNFVKILCIFLHDNNKDYLVFIEHFSDNLSTGRVKASEHNFYISLALSSARWCPSGTHLVRLSIVSLLFLYIVRFSCDVCRGLYSTEVWCPPSSSVSSMTFALYLGIIPMCNSLL